MTVLVLRGRARGRMASSNWSNLVLAGESTPPPSSSPGHEPVLDGWMTAASPAILDAGGLLSDTTVCRRGLLSTEAGDPEIKERRRDQPVTCPPGGFVADYVPFYFAARSPMMYKLFAGRVSSFAGDHRDLVYFVSHVDRAAVAAEGFSISDRNAAKALAEFTNDLALLGDLTSASPQSDFIDWPLMKEQMWNNTVTDGERMERRMAEFLVRGEVPLQNLTLAAVRFDEQKAILERMFRTTGCRLQVVVRRGW